MAVHQLGACLFYQCQSHIRSSLYGFVENLVRILIELLQSVSHYDIATIEFHSLDYFCIQSSPDRDGLVAAT